MLFNKRTHYSRSTIEEDPGTKRETHWPRELRTEFSEKAEAIPLQDQMLRHSDQAADIIWAIAINKLSSKAMKFALNAASNTLYTTQ